MNLWQKSHSNIAGNNGAPPKETPKEQKKKNRYRKKLQLKAYLRWKAAQNSSNADLDEWEQMADELGE